MQSPHKLFACLLIETKVKPENILLTDEDKVKLADFGLSKKYDVNQMNTGG